jgi:hypothetical protein
MQPAPEIPHKETAILDAAVAALRAMGVKAELRPGPNRQAGAQVRLHYGDQTIKFIAEVRQTVNQANLGVIANRLAQLDTPLLVTEHVAPPVAERLRELDIEFADAAGNAYIRKPPLLIWVTGRKPEQRLHETRAARAFQPGGLKLIFALLCKPELADANYRDIAGAAAVALGTVGWVMRDLKEAGFLIDLGKRGRKLTNKRKLLDQWVEGYARQLRPKCLIGRYRALTPDWWREAQPGTLNFQWGGETAAAKMTKYLKPAVTTVYMPENPKDQLDLIKQFRLIKDAAGDVEIREHFWNFAMPDHADMVPPLLVYADLLATADDRNIETARMIYDDHLARLVETA